MKYFRQFSQLYGPTDTTPTPHFTKTSFTISLIYFLRLILIQKIMSFHEIIFISFSFLYVLFFMNLWRLHTIFFTPFFVGFALSQIVWINEWMAYKNVNMHKWKLHLTANRCDKKNVEKKKRGTMDFYHPWN